jgi:cephalosporin-C deacetylase-like acetyl esterase
VEQNSKPVDGVSVQYYLSKDGGAALQSGYAKVENGEARITTTLSDPGFVQLRATYMSGSQSINATAGAAVDPTKITPSLPVPDDFDAFWNAKKALLAKVPVNARVKPVFSGEIDVTAYDVEVDALGAPVSGYLAVPKNAKAGSLPAILTFHGAGVDSAILSRSTTWAKDGLIALDINAHGLPNGQPSTYYSNLYAGELANYRFKGRESRDEFYFLGMYLRVIRAIDYLTTRPEWDGRTLILYGTSQGGAQAYAGAGLDPRVTFVVAGESALADLTGLTVNRAMGWPGASLVAAPSAAVQKNITNTVRYFDVMNMATRIKADGFFTVGFLDPTCPPTTVYAAYNNIKANKTIYNDIGAVHQNTSEALSLMREAVLNHVAKMKTSER